MDKEVEMGLRWTFMAIYWRAMEPNGPISVFDNQAWAELDRFVKEAQARHLNILMQAPVIGGNAGSPPDWAGSREAGKSAPMNMQAAADFAGKMAQRYKPGGIVPTQEGWGNSFGIRAWELDNEPASYLTNWSGQAGDYAEFVTLCAAAIRAEDPDAVIVTPSITSYLSPWLTQTLDAHALEGSPFYRQQGIPHSIGPDTDAVSFHIYEGLDTYLGGEDDTVDCRFVSIRNTFESYENVPGFEYERKKEYWHTEGNFDFGLSELSPEQKASWYWQFMTRAFAAGMRKVCIMDATAAERKAVRIYAQALPAPHPMIYSVDQIEVLAGKAHAFRHPLGDQPQDGRIWVLWAEDGTQGAVVRLPVQSDQVGIVDHLGNTQIIPANGNQVTLGLQGGGDASTTYLLLDR